MHRWEVRRAIRSYKAEPCQESPDYLVTVSIKNTQLIFSFALIIRSRVNDADAKMAPFLRGKSNRPGSQVDSAATSTDSKVRLFYGTVTMTFNGWVELVAQLSLIQAHP